MARNANSKPRPLKYYCDRCDFTVRRSKAILVQHMKNVHGVEL